MTKTLKIIVKIISILIIIQMFTMPVTNALTWNGIFKDGDKFISDGQNASEEQNVFNEKEVKRINSDIYGILLMLGTVLAVIIGAILGIQLMWGSVEQQIKAKEMLMPYVLGCIVVFGAFGIWKVAITVFSKL